MTYQQIIHKVACPTCGAAIGKACGSGAGRLRPEAHAERAASARANAFTASGNAMSSMLARFGIGKKPA